MIKINSGVFGGREITSPPENITRPVTQKVRAAIFSTLGDVEGLSVLDLYAGSGALGFEALSLKSKSVTFVDNSAKAANVIRRNIVDLDVKHQCNVIQKSVENFLQTDSEKFDLIFFDPPYAVFDEQILDLVFKSISPAGIVIVSCSNKTDLPKELGLAEQIKSKIYGDTQIGYYRRAE